MIRRGRASDRTAGVLEGALVDRLQLFAYLCSYRCRPYRFSQIPALGTRASDGVDSRGVVVDLDECRLCSENSPCGLPPSWVCLLWLGRVIECMEMGGLCCLSILSSVREFGRLCGSRDCRTQRYQSTR